MAARVNPVAIQGVDEEDRLSTLPDDVLLSILNRLDLRDAVRTSVLSRRWAHLPVAGELHDIVLDVDSFVRNDGDGFTSKMSSTAWSNRALAYAVKSVLGRRRQRPIRHLAVTFFMRTESIGIVHAVDDAMSPDSGPGIAAAEFTIRAETVDVLCRAADKARHGRLFLSYLRTCPRAFAGLTGLHVESVKLGEFDVPNLLRTCKKLRRLSLLNCDTGRETVLAIEHPQLTELNLDSCNCYGIQLKWLPELSHVTCCCWYPSRHGCPLLFGHVPRLQRLMLSTAGYADYTFFKLSKLLVNCAKLGELHLNFSSNRIWIQPEHPEQLAPLLQNLRFLNLEEISEESDLTWTLFLLQAAPFLKTLQIKLSNHKCITFSDKMEKLLTNLFGHLNKNMQWEVCDFKHYNLAVLNIFGFQLENKFMGYIRRVIKAAVNLKEIALHDQWCEDCKFLPVTTYPQTKKERDFIRRQINQGVTSPIEAVQFYHMSAEGPLLILD